MKKKKKKPPDPTLVQDEDSEEEDTISPLQTEDSEERTLRTRTVSSLSSRRQSRSIDKFNTNLYQKPTNILPVCAVCMRNYYLKN